MDAKTFFEEAHRMCKAHKICTKCPLSCNVVCLFGGTPDNWTPEEIEEAAPIIEKWSHDHPRKTRLQDFLEKYPHAPMDEDRLPFLAPRSVGYCGNTPCFDCKKAKGKTTAWCWEQEVENDETD